MEHLVYTAVVKVCYYSAGIAERGSTMIETVHDVDALEVHDNCCRFGP